jgi:hypothetical protein
MKCSKCNQEIEKKTIIIDGIKYETEDHDFNKKLSDIKIPEGWRLWTAEECIKLKNWNDKNDNKLNLINCWFYIKQPFNLNKDLVARFCADSDGAYLYCDRDPSDSDSDLGVRFCRRVKK